MELINYTCTHTCNNAHDIFDGQVQACIVVVL